jgi:hypothetical protein
MHVSDSQEYWCVCACVCVCVCAESFTRAVKKIVKVARFTGVVMLGEPQAGQFEWGWWLQCMYPIVSGQANW